MEYSRLIIELGKRMVMLMKRNNKIELQFLPNYMGFKHVFNETESEDFTSDSSVVLSSEEESECEGCRIFIIINSYMGRFTAL